MVAEPAWGVIGHGINTRQLANEILEHSACKKIKEYTQVCWKLLWHSFQPVLHDWCNNGMVHIKEPLLLIKKWQQQVSSLSLSEWFFTICPTSYNRKYNLLSALLNKTFPSFLPFILPSFFSRHQILLVRNILIFVENTPSNLLKIFCQIVIWHGTSHYCYTPLVLTSKRS